MMLCAACGKNEGQVGEKPPRPTRDNPLSGLWTLLAPLTFQYGLGTVEPAGGRDLWLSSWARGTAMTWSDIASGLLLLIFGWRSLRPNRPVSLWSAAR